MRLKICSIMLLMVLGFFGGLYSACACDCDTTFEITVCTEDDPSITCTTKSGHVEAECPDYWKDALSPTIDLCMVEDEPIMECNPAGLEACYDYYFVIETSVVHDQECKVHEGEPPSSYCGSIDPDSIFYGKETTCWVCIRGTYFYTFDVENKRCGC